MQQTIAAICLLGAAGIILYVILAMYVGWHILIVPFGLVVVICAIIRRDRRIHGPM